MAKVDQIKLNKFIEQAKIYAEFYKNNKNNADAFNNAISWFFEYQSTISTNEFIDAKAKTIQKLHEIQNMLAALRDDIDSYCSIGQKFSPGFLEKAHDENIVVPRAFIEEIDKFDCWCKERAENIQPPKKGRRFDSSERLVIAMLEFLHFHIFGKLGSLTPNGYYVKETKKRLRR